MRLTLALILLCGCGVDASDEDPPVLEDGKDDGVPLSGNPNVALGVPKDTSRQDDLILSKAQYVLSYNRFRNGPNWVSWRLSAANLGNVDRQNDFKIDRSLPTGYYRVTKADYTNQGYDRGHMCNSEDRSSTVTDNSATFLMTNMLPQKHELNAGPWEGFEAYCRSLAAQGNDLYIIAGGMFTPECSTHLSPKGNLPAPSCARIGNPTVATEQIAVPDSTWKIAIITPAGQQVSEQSRVIAVNMPNSSADPTLNWSPYIVTAQDIEQRTGYHFFTSLPSGVRAALEKQRGTASPPAPASLAARAVASAPADCGTVTDCRSCMELDGCGWCSGACVAGSYDGPETGTCDDWKYIAKECR